MKVHENGTLDLLNVDKDTEGLYMCMARNDRLSIVTSAKVTILGMFRNFTSISFYCPSGQYPLPNNDDKKTNLSKICYTAAFKYKLNFQFQSLLGWMKPGICT